MPRNFKIASIAGAVAPRGPRFWLQIILVTLLIANLAALFLYFDPPGGSRRELLAERQQVRNQISATGINSVRLQSVAGKVQIGATQAGDFERKYFLPKRVAYDSVLSEIQRLATASGLQEREAVYSEEPVEGSTDLTVLNITGNFQGNYGSLMHFLYESDRSPMLLMLDTLQASPQQRGGTIDASIRFQQIIRDDPASSPGGQQ
jgi:Tfp pilus assembly protein PilO